MKKSEKIKEIENRFGENIEKFLRREYNTKGIKEIARYISVNSNTLKDWFFGFGIPLRTNEENLQMFLVEKPPREKLVKMYESNSSNKIAKNYGVTGRTVRNWLKNYGIPLRNKGPFILPPTFAELQAKCEIMNLRQLSDEYKVDRKVVRKWTKNYGIIPDRKSFISHMRRGVDEIKKNAYKKKKAEAKKILDDYNHQMNRELVLEDFFEYIKPILLKYNERFFKNPTRTLSDLEMAIEDSRGFEKRIYSLAYNHYFELNFELKELTEDSSQ